MISALNVIAFHEKKINQKNSTGSIFHCNQFNYFNRYNEVLFKLKNVKEILHSTKEKKRLQCIEEPRDVYVKYTLNTTNRY